MSIILLGFLTLFTWVLLIGQIILQFNSWDNLSPIYLLVNLGSALLATFSFIRLSNNY